MDKRVAKYINTDIGDFKIIDYSSETHKYKCKCNYCGEEKNILKVNFKNEGSIHCKCTKSGVKKGDKYFKLTAIERDMSRLNEGRVYWIWECECGNRLSLPLKQVASGNTKSCGCLNKEKYMKRLNEINSNLEDLTLKVFGKLTVKRLATKEETLNRPKGKRYWYCQCECGNYHIASTEELKAEKVQSCGCLLSKGEAKIAKLLSDNNISFTTQYRFPDLYQYRFDFAIIENNYISYVIEFDGIQHYDKNRQFGNDKLSNFLKIQERDNIKNQYCLKNNIPLIRIPYTRLNELCLDDVLLDKTSYLRKE